MAAQNNSFPVFCCSSLSEQGLVRGNNEDAVACCPADGCFAVADGMGGGEAGEVAGQMVAAAISAAVAGTASESPGERKYVIQQALFRVHAEIAALAGERGYGSMGSTVALLLLDPWTPSRALVCHVGDSRVYCLRSEELFLITSDHTVAEDMRRLEPGKSMEVAGRYSHVLTRSIGMRQTLFPEWTELAVCPDDIFLLCSDGVTAMLSDPEIAEVMRQFRAPEDIAAGLRKRIYEAGARDNFTMIVVVIHELPPAARIPEGELYESNLLMKISERRIDRGTA